MLSHLVEIRRKESVDLTTGVSIEVHTASDKKVRGYTVLAAICDEVAFWKSESSALLRTVISSPTYTHRDDGRHLSAIPAANSSTARGTRPLTTP